MTDGVVPWVDGITIGAMLRETARRFPDHDALVFTSLDREGHPRPTAPVNSAAISSEIATGRAESYRRTWSELDRDVDEVARGLLALGLKPGEHVAVWATNWPRWVLLQYATARIGAVMVTINPAYRSSELAYVLKQSDARVLFLVDHFKSSNYFDILSQAVPELSESSTEGMLQSAQYPRLKHVISMNDATAPGIRGWSDWIAPGSDITNAALAAREGELSATDPINIQYTSGTTGFPKGAMLTHRNILMNAFYIGDCQQLTEADRVCVPVPFYHCFGCVLGVLCCGIYGSAMIVPAEYFQAEATLAAIEQEGATAVYGVPTMFIAQLDHPTFTQRTTSSLRTGIMAGSPCPIEVMKRVVNEMGASEITIAYGLTEASPVITQTRTDDPLEFRVKTVGRPMPGVEVRLINPESGEVLGDNQQGELIARGHGTMVGYYNMPEATAAAINAEQWLHTGDLALRMPNGYYRITGRIKDMICRGGENIYPREIEEFLYTHPAIQDVAVVGVPDRKYVEVTAAWIRLKSGQQATEEEIREFCRGKLAHYKFPAYIRFVQEFPQTVTGKIQKFRIREIMTEDLGLNATETA